MDPQENTRLNMETTTIQWVICSPKFEDIVIIVARDLNRIPIISQYDGIMAKQIHKRYFIAEQCKTQQMKEEN